MLNIEALNIQKNSCSFIPKQQIMNTQQNLNKLFYEHASEIINRNDKIFYSHDSLLIYHYCELDTCSQIIQNQNLRASDIRFMNDPQEFNYGIDLMKEILATKKGEFCDNAQPLLNAFEEKLNSSDIRSLIQRFIVCFSKEKNLPNQWKRYGDNYSGIAIGFEPNKLLGSLYHTPHGYYVVYDRKEQEREIVEILENSINFFSKKGILNKPASLEGCILSLVNLIGFLIPRYKAKENGNDKWYLEQEYRLVYSLDFARKEMFGSELKLEQSGKQYLELYSLSNRDKEDKCETQLSIKLNIQEIIVGSKLDFEFEKNKIESLLEAKGYNKDEIDIKQSACSSDSRLFKNQ